ncbi:hypothetical protein AAHC03_013088 [Spirometra sp. Aus1]
MSRCDSATWRSACSSPEKDNDMEANGDKMSPTPAEGDTSTWSELPGELSPLTVKNLQAASSVLAIPPPKEECAEIPTINARTKQLSSLEASTAEARHSECVFNYTRTGELPRKAAPKVHAETVPLQKRVVKHEPLQAPPFLSCASAQKTASYEVHLEVLPKRQNKRCSRGLIPSHIQKDATESLESSRTFPRISVDRTDDHPLKTVCVEISDRTITVTSDGLSPQKYRLPASQTAGVSFSFTMNDQCEKSSSPLSTPSLNSHVTQATQRLRTRDLQVPKSTLPPETSENSSRNGTTFRPEQRDGGQIASPNSTDIQITRGDQTQSPEPTSSNSGSSGMEESELKAFLRFLQGTINAYSLDHRSLQQHQGGKRTGLPKHHASAGSYYEGTKLLDVITHALGDNNSRTFNDGRTTRFSRPTFREDGFGRRR